jgi:membrane-bound lytic murein transglycosylase D
MLIAWVSFFKEQSLLDTSPKESLKPREELQYRVKTKARLIFPLLYALGVIFLTFAGCATPTPSKSIASPAQLPPAGEKNVSLKSDGRQATKNTPSQPEEAPSRENAETPDENGCKTAGDLTEEATGQGNGPESAGLIPGQEIPVYPDEETAGLPASIPDQELGNEANSPDNVQPTATKDIPKKTNQELLDGALEFCQASNDFWKRGNLDEALDALDQAYSLILQVDPDDNPELLQQREDLRFTIAKRIIEIYSSRLTVVHGYHKAIPLSMNRYVDRAVKHFQGVERSFFLQSYKRSGRYRPAIVKALKKAGLPEDLSWLPLIESGFNIRAFSKARALGLWQFIASTGYKYGLERDRWIDERMDPEKATQAAISYLKELHQIFGDWTTALAAYNCGEGTVLKCIRTQQVNYLDNFWDLYEKLPSETASYVPRFLAVLHIIQNPEKYGFSLPQVDAPLEADEVPVEKPVRLETIAKTLNVSCSELLDLNPELKRHSTPARSYELRVPKGKGDLLLAKLPTIPTWKPQIPDFVYHRVRRGEVLSLIARKYRTSVTAIMRANGLRSSRYLRVGWRLKVPVGRKYVLEQQPLRQEYNAESVQQITEKKRYVVKKGDSLWRIARRFGTTTDAIQNANSLRNAELSTGQVLIIRGDSASAADQGNSVKYRVRQGDSPYTIAQRHQMNLSEFLQLNSLTPRSTIFPGQTVLVKTN